jgi:uncharacterized protein YkwD
MMQRVASALATLFALAATFVTLSPGASSIESQMLKAHNAVRERLRLRPLVWSEKLAQGAQEWADLLIREGAFRHRPRSPWGQNLYEIVGTEYFPQQIVNGWVDEFRDYDLASNRCKPDRMCGHYTQIVWRDTKELGCAVAHGGRREIWVCEYYPPGNVLGERPY